MKPWDDSELRLIVADSMKLQKTLRQKQLQDILLSFNNLPSPPRLHNKLKEILQKDQKSQKDIASEIEKSPALVARLLRISNSVFYGARRSISSVFDALTFIGTESVLNIVLGLELFDSLSANAPEEIVRKAEEIRITSVIRAQIAREIALRWDNNVDPQEAYVAGLMLDIGLVLRFCTSPEKFGNFGSAYMNNRKPMFVIDKEIYSVTHDEMGEALLTYWNFSPHIIATVANHHCYTGEDPLTTIVQIADSLTQGNDSLPHDPSIDDYVNEWKVKLSEILNTFINQ